MKNKISAGVKIKKIDYVIAPTNDQLGAGFLHYGTNFQHSGSSIHLATEQAQFQSIYSKHLVDNVG